MFKQLKVAATVAITALGFIAAAPVQALPSSALEFSQQTYTPPAQVQVQRVATAAATRTTTFPSAGMEP